MNIKKLRLQPEQLCEKVDPLSLGFETTDELEPTSSFLGHDRAKQALDYGLESSHKGHNIFVMGDPGSGKQTFVRQAVGCQALTADSPSDYLYVNNFREPREPWAIQLPTGSGSKLLKVMEDLINTLLSMFPAAFENPAYQRQKAGIEREFTSHYETVIREVEKEANAKGFALKEEQGVLSFEAIIDGKSVDEIAFATLEEDIRNQINESIRKLEDRLNEALLELPQWRREIDEKIAVLNADTINRAVDKHLYEIEQKYSGIPGVLLYIKDMRRDLVNTILSHLYDREMAGPTHDTSKKEFLTERYLPNLLVENTPNSGAPVVYEPQPTLQNLFGRLEYQNKQGSLITSYRHIRAGSLHRANGGYLIIESDKLLEEPWSWDVLKHSLTSMKLHLEAPYLEVGLISTVDLNPHVIPLDVKVILIGPREAFYLLQEYDDDFNVLFRVLVDFDNDLPKTPKNISAFSELLKAELDASHYRPLNAAAVSRLLDYSSRLAENKTLLTAHFHEVFDVLTQSELLARKQNAQIVDAEHIEFSLNQKFHRSGRIYEYYLDEMINERIRIATDGIMGGTVNGLTVTDVGGSCFGTPARITATVYPGSKGVVDIEREADLGESIHSKGVLILTGFLGWRYAHDFPLTVSANITMEQSYGKIDGDSASLAELCALISAISKNPIDQHFAVTGSLNQMGDVQAVGGINEKIEGFFHLCEHRGLDGKHGVIIPGDNINDLMLNQKVIDAVEKGEFSIYGINHVDEALNILINKPVGKPNKTTGKYPRGSINHKVVQELKRLSTYYHPHD